MKRISSTCFAWLAGFLLVSSAGCNKKIDKLPDVSSLCSIQLVTTPGLGPNDTDTLRFSYDHYGNPATINRLETATERNDYTFWYDHEHRLTDVIATYALPVRSGDGFDTWDKFYYTNGKITLDTLFDFGVINGSRPGSYLGEGIPLIRRISDYKYDVSGRINWVRDNFNGLIVTQSFTYNRDGNLAKVVQTSYYPGSLHPYDTAMTQVSGYDNKINVDQTHPIWQFLDRNYSENNRFIADVYNEACLPVVITHRNESSVSGITLPQAFIYIHPEDPLTVKYNCQLPEQGYGHGY